MQDRETNMTFLETAGRIGARLCRDAIWHGGRCNWIGGSAEPAGGFTHAALGPALYSGTAGIALLLLRLYAATQEAIFRRTAEGALRQSLARRNDTSIGLFDGAAGIAYAAGCAAEITGEEDWLREAIGIAGSIAPRQGRIDIINGSAGIVAALLALARMGGGGGLVEAAQPHAAFLMENANRGEGGWSWGTMEKRHADLTGFAHGAAGIGFALLEMFRATGDPTYRNAAEEGFRYEQGVFDATRGNWPDFRHAPQNGEFAFAVMWCAGAPGIGLSRLRAAEILGDAARREEGRVAIRTTIDWLEEAEDANFSLCHGLAGNAELLLDSGEAEFVRIAQGVGEAGIRRYESEGEPWPCGTHSDFEPPGLMLGLAGIAHFYLRLHDAAAVPSVLRLTA
jgi:lantibiotic modifying enzyme